MTSITYRKNKKTGRTYAYQTESYRDPTTKKVKTRQRYLGVVEPDTGQITSKSKAKPEYDNINLNHIMPNNITDNIRPIVACMAPPALEPALDNEGPIADCMEPSTLSNESPTIDYKAPARLYKNLHTKAYKKIPTIITKSLGPRIVLDKVCEELSLTNLLKLSFPTLYTDILSMVYCIVETGGALENYGIWSDSSEHPANKSYNSEHINYLIENIDIKQIDKFMKAWLRRFIDRKYLCYDLTSLPSYDEIIPLIGKGQTYFTKFKKIYLALLFDQQRNLPVYYYRSHNNIFDFEDIDQINNVFESKGIENTGFILDTEYFMDGKIDKILSNDSTHFTLAVPYRHWLQEIIYKYSHNIYKPASYHVLYEKEHLFSITKVLKWHSTNRKFYLHIYFDKDRTLDDYILFLNDEILIREFDNAGFFCILSTFMDDPMEAWQTYLRRDLVEKCFDNLIDITSTNSFIPNTNNRIEIKIFLHFLSAIITSQIKNTIKNDQKLRMFSPKYLLHNISALRKNYLEAIPQEFYSEINDLQKHILDVFGLKWPA